jgi:hypothetical protein
MIYINATHMVMLVVKEPVWLFKLRAGIL